MPFNALREEKAMLNDELIEPVPTLKLSAYNFLAEIKIIELLIYLKADIFDANEFERVGAD
jgi:hypothetical protein